MLELSSLHPCLASLSLAKTSCVAENDAVFPVAKRPKKKNLGEEFAIQWLARHGLRAERFSTVEMRQSKTPDFRVFKDTELVLYCESKRRAH
jgi:hypothetical protein